MKCVLVSDEHRKLLEEKGEKKNFKNNYLFIFKWSGGSD